MAMEDYFFKTPVSVPFKWEIRPGVPKIHHHHQQKPSSNHHHSHSFLHQEQHSTNHNRSSTNLPQKLTPPPAAGFTFQPHMELRTRSVLSIPRTRSRRNRFILAQPEIVSAGCFTTKPATTLKEKKKRAPKLTTESELETDCTSDLETLSRWSVSTQKSLSPFHDSPFSSRFSSYQSSPRLVSDAEWAGFGLF